MLASPTLTNSVLQKQTVTIAVNEFGFRDSAAINEARIFALGDSFTFGWGVNADLSWVKLLQKRLGAVVYNLGIHNASPKQELELLRAPLSKANAPKVERLVWMIFEGNDLEGSYDEFAPSKSHKSLTSGTVLEALSKIPHALRGQSVVRKILDGQIRFRFSSSVARLSHYAVDGVTLAHPIFHSNALGSKLFYQPHLDWAQNGKNYLDSHPNRAKLVRVFDQMRKLADSAGFEVAVVVAPTDVSVHGRYFTEFPKISPERWFASFIVGLAEECQFKIIDLYEPLLARAARRLLYFRDDDHWNEMGHEAVAESLANQLPGWSQRD